MDKVLIKKLSPGKELPDFICGNEEIDRYYKCNLTKDVYQKLCVAYVAISQTGKLLGFITLSNDIIQKDSLSRPNRKILHLSHDTYAQIPATLIGRLGVSLTHQRKGVGELLVTFALAQASKTSNSVASVAVVLDPLSEKVGKWYQEKFDFLPLKNDHRLFIPLSIVPENDESRIKL